MYRNVCVICVIGHCPGGTSTFGLLGLQRCNSGLKRCQLRLCSRPPVADPQNGKFHTSWRGWRLGIPRPDGIPHSQNFSARVVAQAGTRKSKWPLSQTAILVDVGEYGLARNSWIICRSHWNIRRHLRCGVGNLAMAGYKTQRRCDGRFSARFEDWRTKPASVGTSQRHAGAIRPAKEGELRIGKEGCGRSRRPIKS
jgi:hypothetical protein